MKTELNNELDIMANNLMVMKEKPRVEKRRKIADENIINVFKKWDIKKIPKWKQNLLFDRVEDFIEDQISKSKMYLECKNVILEK